MFRVDGKTAWVTGGTNGLGQVMAGGRWRRPAPIW
jgi:short-subunit dehydrogenase